MPFIRCQRTQKIISYNIYIYIISYNSNQILGGLQRTANYLPAFCFLLQKTRRNLAWLSSLVLPFLHINWLSCCIPGFTDERLPPSVNTVKLAGDRNCQRSLRRSVGQRHFIWEFPKNAGLKAVKGRSTSLVVVFVNVSTRSKRSRQGPVMEEDGMLKMFHCPYEGCSQVYVAISSFQVNDRPTENKSK